MGALTVSTNNMPLMLELIVVPTLLLDNVTAMLQCGLDASKLASSKALSNE